MIKKSRLFFLLSILSLIFILIYFIFSQPIEISSKEDLLSLNENTKVKFNGTIIEEDYYYSRKMCILNSKIKFECQSQDSLINKSVEIIGLMKYKANPYISPLSSKTSN
jgi:hypothetical protein